MKNIFIAICFLIGAVSCSPKADHQDKPASNNMKQDSSMSCCASKDGIFLHISSGYENPHKVLMALKMAAMMSMDKDVLVYIDIKGVETVVKTSKDMKFKDFPTLFELLDELAAKKVTVMACPTCLKIAGYKEEDLRQGIIIANKDKFFNFTKGRIITLDY